MTLSDDELDRLVDDHLAGELTTDGRARLEAALRASGDARRAFWHRAHLHAALTNLAAEDDGSQRARALAPARRAALSPLLPLAAVLVLLAAALALLWPASHSTEITSGARSLPIAPEPVSAATLTRRFGTRWGGSAPAAPGGALAPGQPLELLAGLAELRFASGAVAVIKGPTTIIVESALRATLREGIVEVDVPPAAHGFEIATADGIVMRDLGTRFTVRATSGGSAELHVAEGEVEVERSPSDAAPSRRVTAGEALAADPAGPARSIAFRRSALREELAMSVRLASWKVQRDTLAADPDVLAYFTFANDAPPGQVRNLSSRDGSDPFATLRTARRVPGRWPDIPALRFDDREDRVQLRIDGAHPNLTFAAWVRPDRLAHDHNSLFMSEFGLAGEAHWQLARDGAFRFAVRRAGATGLQGFHEFLGGTPLAQGPAAPWQHLATTYSADIAEVIHYRDGTEVARRQVSNLPSLRFGQATLGNWQSLEPEILRQIADSDQWATRFWHGAIDEFLLLARVLGPEEIRQLADPPPPLE